MLFRNKGLEWRKVDAAVYERVWANGNSHMTIVRVCRPQHHHQIFVLNVSRYLHERDQLRRD